MIYLNDYTLPKEAIKHLAGFTQKWGQVRILVDKKGIHCQLYRECTSWSFFILAIKTLTS